MNTENYGDVLLIPAVIEKSDYPKFFASLGTQAELAKKYRFTGYTTVDGKVYGQSPIGVDPRLRLQQEGLAARPASPTGPPHRQSSSTALKAIKAKTDAIPYYTNFDDQWPLTSVDERRSARSAATPAPTTSWRGRPLGRRAPTCASATPCCTTSCTTGWPRRTRRPPTGRTPRPRSAKGKIATQWLGSWAVVQCGTRRRRPASTPPTSASCPSRPRSGGKFCAVVGPDYNQAVNIHSEHKAAARAWIDWFTDKSGYARGQPGHLPAQGRPAARRAQAVHGRRRQVHRASTTPTRRTGQAHRQRRPRSASTSPDYRQELVDLARGAPQGRASTASSGTSASAGPTPQTVRWGTR